MVATVVTAAVSVGLMLFGIQYREAIAALTGSHVAAIDRMRFGLTRVEGPFGQPLVYAIWLTATVPLLFPRAGGLPRGGQPWLAAAGILILALALLLTVSRSAIVVGSLLPAGYLARRSRLRAAAWAAAAAIPISLICIQISGSSGVIGSASLAPFPTGGSSSVPRATATPDVLAQSGELRLEAYRTALIAVGAQPLFGHGLLEGSETLSQLSGRQNYVDSAYLQVAVEQGIIGLVLLLVLLWLTIREVVKRDRRGGRSAFLVSLIAACALAGLASLFTFTPAYALFWLLAGAAGSGRVVARSTGTQRVGDMV